MPRGKKSDSVKVVVANKFNDKRVGIPTAEEASYADRMALMPTQLKYPRNPDLDPQLVWRAKTCRMSIRWRSRRIRSTFRRRSTRRRLSKT